MGIPIIAGYGSKNKCLESFTGVCPFCQKETTLKIYETSNNVNLYFVPIAKFNKHFYLVCHLCDKSLELTWDQKEDLLYKMRYRNNEIIRSFTPQMPATVSNAPRLYSPKVTEGIEVLTGSLTGKKFEILDGTTRTLGKDRNIANIHFDNSYNMVSRVHCTITFSAQYNKYYVTDNSTNGTYLENGTRLKKGVRTAVKRGSVIKLADDRCKIRLI